MLTPSRFEQLEEIHRRQLSGLPVDDDEIEAEMIDDLFTMLKTMALRNEVLKEENNALRRNMGLEAKG